MNDLNTLFINNRMIDLIISFSPYHYEYLSKMDFASWIQAIQKDLLGRQVFMMSYYYDWHLCLHFREGKFICLLVSVSWHDLLYISYV